MECKRCNAKLTADNWYPSFQKSYNYTCTNCAKQQTKKWCEANEDAAREHSKKSKQKRKEQDKKNSRDYYHKRPDVAMWSRAKKRAKEKGLDFDIEVSDVNIPDRCPLLGIPLNVSDSISRAGSPSLDRIVPSKGYVKGNVWVISHKANTVKSDLTLKELDDILISIKAILKEHK